MKRIKMVFLLIIVIVLSISIFIFRSSTSMSYEKYKGKIYKIEGNNIFIEVTDTTTFGFLKNNAHLYDINQNKLDVSELKVGDTVYVNENYEYETFNNNSDYKYEEEALHNQIPMENVTKNSLLKGLIEKIDEQFIVVNIQKEYCYCCSIENAIIRNSWHKITIDKLNIGDIVEITNKKSIYASSPIDNTTSTLYDVKSVKVLNDNIK